MINVEKIKPTGLFTNYIYKAIPLAFDESMSYYETLCGLLSYLKNTVIPTLNNNADAIVELQNLYNQLHDYVEHYFDNLDVQEEINNKLDDMVEDGTLAEIINNEVFTEIQNDLTDVENLVNSLNSDVTNLSNSVSTNTNNINNLTNNLLNTSTNLQTQINNNTSNINIQKQRIDEITTLPEGSTTADAELIDIRIGANGITYDSAGNSVRGQYNDLNDKIDNIFTTPTTINYFDKNKSILGKYINNISHTPPQIDTANYMLYNMVVIDEPTTYYLKYPVGSLGQNNYKVPLYEEDGTYVQNLSGVYVSGSGNDTIISLTITPLLWENGVRIIGVNQRINMNENLMVTKIAYPDTYIEYNDFQYNEKLRIKSSQIVPSTNPLEYNGKEISIFSKGFCAGDSLTAGTFNHNEGGSTEYTVISKYSYPSYLNKFYSCNAVNWGYGGLSTKGYYEYLQSQTIANDYDFVIIQLGANDVTANNIPESLDYYQRLITFFKNKWNHVKIFCCTITPSYYANNTTFYDSYNEDVVKYCVEHNSDCYLIDLTTYSKCLPNSAYVNEHLTAYGYLQTAQEIGSAISYIINNNKNDFKYVQFIDTTYSQS